jgi:hypothetical protein
MYGKTIDNAENRKCIEKCHSAYPKGMQSQCLYLYLLKHTGTIQVLKNRKVVSTGMYKKNTVIY